MIAASAGFRWSTAYTRQCSYRSIHVIPLIATVGTVILSILVIRLDRDPVRISKAVWIPFLWLCIASSRPVSNWIRFDGPVDVTSQYIDGSPLDRNVLTLLLLMAVGVLFRKAHKIRDILRLNPALMIFLAYCGVSMLWADYPLVVFKRWIREVADVAMMLVIIVESYPADAFRRVLMWVASVLVPLSILFTRFFPSLGRSYTYSGVPMWTGVATDKNALGALCMIVGVVLVSRGVTIFRARKTALQRRQLWIVMALLAMVLYVLLKIDSKTALACFVLAVGLIVSLAYIPLLRRTGFVTAMVVFMVGGVYSMLFLGVGSSALSELGRDSSLTGRTRAWEIVLAHTVNPWIGSGYENFWIGKRYEVVARAIAGIPDGEPIGGGLNQAHNGYLEIYLNIGWVGLFLLAAVIIFGYRNILKTMQADPATAGLKLAFVFICLVYNFTEAAFKILSPVWITLLWAVLAVPRAGVRVAEPSLAAPGTAPVKLGGWSWGGSGGQSSREEKFVAEVRAGQEQVVSEDRSDWHRPKRRSWHEAGRKV